MTKGEKLYQATMSFARTLLKKGLLTEEEYRIIDAKYTRKYAPGSGTLLSDIDLIKTELYGNIPH